MRLPRGSLLHSKGGSGKAFTNLSWARKFQFKMNYKLATKWRHGSKYGAYRSWLSAPGSLPGFQRCMVCFVRFCFKNREETWHLINQPVKSSSVKDWTRLLSAVPQAELKPTKKSQGEADWDFVHGITLSELKLLEKEKACFIRYCTPPLPPPHPSPSLEAFRQS